MVNPFTNVIIPSVARIGETPTQVMRRPFARPIMRETIKPAAIAIKIIPAISKLPATCGVYCIKMSAVIIPDKFAAAIIERLIPPPNIVIIIASDKSPSSGIWKAID